MSKFNQPVAMRIRATSPITTTSTPAATYNGAAGTARDTRSELFVLAVANMAGEASFYEAADARDARFRELVHTVAVDDPDWTGRFINWLRTGANMRSASVVAAAEAVHARLAAGLHGGNRALIGAACARADEPGELLAYWTSRFGRAVPKPVKRGLADAVARLYTERALIKYDTDSHGYRLGDVIDLVHPTARPDRPWQGALFAHALDRRHGRDTAIPNALPTLAANAALRALPPTERRALICQPDAADVLARAGFTWEMLAGWLSGPMDATAWEAIIPSMGLMALVRNLRNFDAAGISDTAVDAVTARLSDPAQVAGSRMFPFRFFAAHANTGSLNWGRALERALAASLANVPALPGRTLILVDQSPSMFPGFPFSTPNTSDIPLATKAAIFGAALALRAEHADLVGYGDGSYAVPFGRGDSVLRTVERFKMDSGTDTPRAMLTHFNDHDRVVIVTDEQTSRSVTGRTVDNAVPNKVPVYTWNLAGYRPAHAGSGGAARHTFAGLTDAAFAMIPLLEAGASAAWPF